MEEDAGRRGRRGEGRGWEEAQDVVEVVEKERLYRRVEALGVELSGAGGGRDVRHLLEYRAQAVSACLVCLDATSLDESRLPFAVRGKACAALTRVLIGPHMFDFESNL